MAESHYAVLGNQSISYVCFFVGFFFIKTVRTNSEKKSE